MRQVLGGHFPPANVAGSSMIVVVARPTSEGFSYTIAPTGAKPATTDWAWEAVEILRELGVDEGYGPIGEAQERGASILRDGSLDHSDPTS